jgi:hypothetical protein
MRTLADSRVALVRGLMVALVMVALVMIASGCGADVIDAGRAGTGGQLDAGTGDRDAGGGGASVRAGQGGTGGEGGASGQGGASGSGAMDAGRAGTGGEAGAGGKSGSGAGEDGGTSGEGGASGSGAAGGSSGAGGSGGTSGSGGAGGTSGTGGTGGGTSAEEICAQPMEIGPCDGVFPRYWYNPQSGNCVQFEYGGCDGNQNNFETLEQCESTCIDSFAELCSDAGGECTEYRWMTCPPNTQTIHPNPHRDCGHSPDVAGWCCVAAPVSTCSAAPGATCVPGSECTGCWGIPPDTSLTCPPGRVCCADICD